MNFIIAAGTDIGNTKDTNQDSFNVRVFTTKIGKAVFAILCDGMGGLSKGEVASASLVKAFCKWSEDKFPYFCEYGFTDEDIKNDWTSLAIEYNEKIKTYGKRCGISIGTTVTAMLITESKYYIINVGDTRAYEIHDRTSVLTKDQTVVAREVELGNLTPQEAERDPRRSVLLQCIGASDEVYPDMFFGQTKLNAVYMLCSDGFRHEINEEEISENFNPDIMLSDAAMKTNIDRLINLNKQRQERDNITAITIRTF